MRQKKTAIYPYLIALLSALIFIPFLGGVHLFDWDEINFAEAAREMIVTGDYLTVQIDFQPFWEKPPLFIYLQVLSMKVFGINEFAARFPNALCGIVTLLVLYNIGRKLKDEKFGLIWTLAYAGSVLPFFYFKSGIIDPWFNLFIFLGVYYLMLYSFEHDPRKIRNVALSGFFAGLAVLTKGPVGFLLIALTGGVYLLVILFKIKVKIHEVLIYFLVLGITGGLWFIVQILNGNMETVVAFIDYQVRLFQTEDAGHGGFFGYHFVVLLFGVFPTSVLALKSFKRITESNTQFALMQRWMTILFWVVLILFSIVKTKILHYSSLAYFPLSFLAAAWVTREAPGVRWSKWQSALVLVISFVIALPVIALQFVIKYKDLIISKDLIHDDFAVANLMAEVRWSGLEFLPGLLFLIAVVLVLVYTDPVNRLKRSVYLWGTTLFFTWSVMVFLVPKVEKYSQNALIEFFKSVSEKDAYIKNLNFKSYATWYYGNTQPPENENYYDDNWLLTGDIDKDVYFATKIHLIHLAEQYPELEKIGEKNGFVFYVRRAKN